MTREELDEHIQYLEGSWFSGWATPMVVDWLKDIRDNGITEPRKYRIRINDKNLPTPLYLCDVCGDTLFAPENDQFLVYRVTKDKNYAAAFTKKFIMDNFKNYLAIDWDKALEPVEE
mgnify:CR=1 FL=1